MKRNHGLLMLSLLVVFAAARPTRAGARSGTRPRARVAPRVSVRAVKHRLQKLRKALLAKRGKVIKLASFFKAHGMVKENLECEGTTRSIMVSKLSPRWRGRTAWSLLLVYRTSGSEPTYSVCWIEARRVKGRFVWATIGSPGPGPKMKVGKASWKRRGRCIVGRFEASFEHPTASTEIGETRKRFYYSFISKENAVWDQELVIEHAEGTVPIIGKRQKGKVKWRRLGKSYYLIHSLVTTKHGGNHGEKVIGKSLTRTVFQLDPSCDLNEQTAAQVKKIRRLRGGKKIPLPVRGN